MGQLQTIESELKGLGFRIVGVSPDRPEALRESVAKLDLTYELVSDSSMDVARAFGIAFKVDDETIARYKEYGIDLDQTAGQLPVPSVFVINTEGNVIFAHANPDYRVRLQPDILLAVARAETAE
ncbi:MAG: redoxin domain-containing protein [Acidobacteriota bacterium]|nr:MAG: redoxin domain-containing protein [Acidobacteriota bacterium]